MKKDRTICFFFSHSPSGKDYSNEKVGGEVKRQREREKKKERINASKRKMLATYFHSKTSNIGSSC